MQDTALQHSRPRGEAGELLVIEVEGLGQHLLLGGRGAGQIGVERGVVEVEPHDSREEVGTSRDGRLQFSPFGEGEAVGLERFDGSGVSVRESVEAVRSEQFGECEELIGHQSKVDEI